MDQVMNRFYAGMIANRIAYPDDQEAALLELIEDGATLQQELDEFRAERAAGLLTKEAYRKKYPRIYAHEDCQED